MVKKLTDRIIDLEKDNELNKNTIAVLKAAIDILQKDEIESLKPVVSYPIPTLQKLQIFHHSYDIAMVEDMVKAFVKAGDCTKKIRCIQVIRALTGWGFKESRDYLNRYWS